MISQKTTSSFPKKKERKAHIFGDIFEWRLDFTWSNLRWFEQSLNSNLERQQRTIRRAIPSAQERIFLTNDVFTRMTIKLTRQMSLA